MLKRTALRFLRILITTVLLIYVIHAAGLFQPQGWVELFDRFAHAKLFLLVASVGIEQLLNFSSSVKWYFLARARDLQVGLWRLFGYYMVGKFFNLVLPSSIGGDVVRMHALGRYTGRYADATAVVFVERFTGLATLVVLALIAVIVNLQIFNLPWLTAALGISTLGMGCICWLILDQRPFKVAQRLFAKVLFLQKLFAKISKFRQAVLAYQNNPGALYWSLVNSLIFYFLAIANVWISLLAFGADIEFMSIVVAVPVIMFIMNIPLSVGGIGLMEFAYSFTLGLFGVPPAIAISTALLMRAKSFIDAGLGSILYPLLGGENSIPREFSKTVGQDYEQEPGK